MANVLIEHDTMTAIANAIRTKKGVSTTYKPSEIPDAISSISGGTTPTGTKNISITANGVTTEDVTDYASAKITTNVPASAVDTGTKNISSNGTHDVTGYASASVSVANSYSAGDEGKVVSSGALVSQSSQSINENGTYDTTLKNSVSVSVPNSYVAGDEGKVVSSGALVSQSSATYTANDTYDTTLKNSVTVNVPASAVDSGTKSISSNGTHDVVGYASASVSVPNSYSAGDEGKVVSNGALVAQTSDTVTTNDTYDTTLINSLTVNVSGGGVNSADGYIELSDTSTNNVVIPVDLRTASYFLINFYVVETGEVSGGVVTKYNNIEIPTAFDNTSHNFVWNYMLKYPQNPAPVVYRDAENLSSVTKCYNTSYVYARRGSNGAGIGLDLAPTINSSGVTILTQNGTRLFCLPGAYAKFKYEVQWW